MNWKEPVNMPFWVALASHCAWFVMAVFFTLTFTTNIYCLIPASVLLVVWTVICAIRVIIQRK